MATSRELQAELDSISGAMGRTQTDLDALIPSMRNSASDLSYCLDGTNVANARDLSHGVEIAQSSLDQAVKAINDAQHTLRTYKETRV